MLLSLNIIILRSIQILHPFLLQCSIPLHEYSSLLIHSPVDGHLGCFQFWAINICYGLVSPQNSYIKSLTPNVIVSGDRIFRRKIRLNDVVRREFPGGLVVTIWCFHCCGPSSTSGQGTEIPQATGHGQNFKKWCHRVGS